MHKYYFMKLFKIYTPVLAIAVFASCNTMDTRLGADSTVENISQFIDLSAMDTSTHPGDDFFRYANGAWYDTVTIPSDKSGVGAFEKLRDNSTIRMKSILEGISTDAKDSTERLVAGFYRSGMDTATIEKLGYEPLKPLLNRLDSIKDVKQLMEFVAAESKRFNNSVIGFYVAPDDKNSAMNVAQFYQTGLGLPDRDYYFKNDSATQKIQNAYKEYLKNAFELTGNLAADAEKNADLVYNLEKKLAESHRTRVEMRDPIKNYNKFTVADLDKKYPQIAWSQMLTNLGAQNVDSVIVGQPDYYTKLNQLLQTVSIEEWKAYLRAHSIDNYASVLSSPFVNAQFNYNKTLTGLSENKPRWERLSVMTDDYLGEALGKLYVDKYFNQDAKNRMMVLVANLGQAFSTRINNLDWMSDSTKQTAQQKLSAIINKIGFPDKWRNYSAVKITKGDFFGNVISAAENEYNFNLSQLGKPVDKTLWHMSPPTVNAYYNPSVNEIVFPAGILQFPFFDPHADDAINYGGIGMVIGHEITHGFDDQGSQYDKDGNLKNWWTAQDREKFQTKVEQIQKQYDEFTVLDSLHVNGKLTTGENIADFGGVAIAYDAFQLTEQAKDTTKKIDGFTPNQRFFLSIAQIWRSKYKDEILRQRINTGPHSPAQWRVLGPLMNFTPFYQAFNVQPGNKMYKPENERIKIW